MCLFFKNTYLITHDAKLNKENFYSILFLQNFSAYIFILVLSKVLLHNFYRISYIHQLYVEVGSNNLTIYLQLYLTITILKFHLLKRLSSIKCLNLSKKVKIKYSYFCHLKNYKKPYKSDSVYRLAILFMLKNLIKLYIFASTFYN